MKVEPATIETMASKARELNSSLPRVLIRPSRGWVSLNLRELWAYRELGMFFVWRDLKVRYKQTVFGVVWAVIQPLLLVFVFSLFLGRFASLAPTGIPYPLFAFAGLVPWMLFSKSLVGAADSLLGASNLIQKVYFPRLLLPISALGSHVFDFILGFGVLLVMMLYFGISPQVSLVWIVPMGILTLITSLAAGVWLSAANVRYRDVRQLVPFIVQLWLFASPVIYTADLVPADWLWLYRLNPMSGVIEGFRWAVLGQGSAPPLDALLVSAGVTSLVLMSGVLYFRRVERTFADVI